MLLQISGPSVSKGRVKKGSRSTLFWADRVCSQHRSRCKPTWWPSTHGHGFRRQPLRCSCIGFLPKRAPSGSSVQRFGRMAGPNAPFVLGLLPGRSEAQPPLLVLQVTRPAQPGGALSAEPYTDGAPLRATSHELWHPRSAATPSCGDVAGVARMQASSQTWHRRDTSRIHRNLLVGGADTPNSSSVLKKFVCSQSTADGDNSPERRDWAKGPAIIAVLATRIMKKTSSREESVPIRLVVVRTCWLLRHRPRAKECPPPPQVGWNLNHIQWQRPRITSTDVGRPWESRVLAHTRREAS
jgi:hypothetical protein